MLTAIGVVGRGVASIALKTTTALARQQVELKLLRGDANGPPSKGWSYSREEGWLKKVGDYTVIIDWHPNARVTWTLHHDQGDESPIVKEGRPKDGYVLTAMETCDQLLMARAPLTRKPKETTP